MILSLLPKVVAFQAKKPPFCRFLPICVRSTRKIATYPETSALYRRKGTILPATANHQGRRTPALSFQIPAVTSVPFSTFIIYSSAKRNASLAVIKIRVLINTINQSIFISLYLFAPVPHYNVSTEGRWIGLWPRRPQRKIGR